MSSLNGDKSRFHRVRKQNIARRKRTRELMEHAATQGKPEKKSGATATKPVTA